MNLRPDSVLIEYESPLAYIAVGAGKAVNVIVPPKQVRTAIGDTKIRQALPEIFRGTWVLEFYSVGSLVYLTALDTEHTGRTLSQGDNLTGTLTTRIAAATDKPTLYVLTDQILTPFTGLNIYTTWTNGAAGASPVKIRAVLYPDIAPTDAR